MSNPWNTTPVDVALAPFHKLLKSLDTHTNIINLPSEPINNPPQNTLILKLREADQIARRRREKQFMDKAIDIKPEIKQVVVFNKRLTDLFQKLSQDLENLSQNDLLKQSYIQAFRRSQVVWDDISQENKAKLVNSIRSAIRAISKVFQAKEKQPNFIEYEKNLNDLITRTDIFNESKEFDDLYLEDLYDLLTECSNCLEIIKREPSL